MRLRVLNIVFLLVFSFLAFTVNAQEKIKEKEGDLNSRVDIKDSKYKELDNATQEVHYDPISGTFKRYLKFDDILLEVPEVISMEDYIDQDITNYIQRYRKNNFLTGSANERSKWLAKFGISDDAFETLFGGGDIDIIPQGFVELTVGVRTSINNNPSLSEDMRKVTSFKFDENINFGVEGKIGDRVNILFNYNTNSTFDFENQLKISYDYSSILDSLEQFADLSSPYQDDRILKNIQVGNISMETDNSLISGGSNLFGARADMQFGKLSVSTVLSQQKGESINVQVKGGSVVSEFDISVVDYDADKHFFLGHYFKENFDEALENLPIVNSPINIEKIEVWITNQTSQFESSRSVVGFTDLGEKGDNKESTLFTDNTQSYPNSIYPSNSSNKLYEEMTTTYGAVRDISSITETLAPLSSSGFTASKDYDKIESARLLSSSEYEIDTKLGYISLNRSLQGDEVLAVAYSYTAKGQRFQVGEFSTDGIASPETLVLKLLKSTSVTPQHKLWELMMKNIYRLGTSQLSNEDFKLDVVYRDSRSGKDLNYLPDGPLGEQILIDIFNVDNQDQFGDGIPDGLFDFEEGITVRADRGEIIFPAAEPFGEYLEAKLEGNQASISKYVYNELYTSTKTKARESSAYNWYSLKGEFKGDSNSEIYLNTFNLTPGSVTITAGGQTLIENIDYTVDYNLAKVRIINSSILASNQVLNISTESEELFSVSTKTLMGAQLNYQFNPELNIGGTFMYMHEQPVTTQPTVDDNAISNIMFGLNGSYVRELDWLTDLVDRLPTVTTDAKSTIAVDAEYAQIIPGSSSNTVDSDAAYLDDFEGSQSSITLKSALAWKLASVPMGDDQYPEGNLINDLQAGYNRAKLAWYVIDPVLQRRTSETPSNLRDNTDLQSSHYVREVYYSELFPDKEIATGDATNIPTLDLMYTPYERGEYNFDTYSSTYSKGVNSDGTLKEPESRWGGIMREITTSDFESANVEFIEFWMMDPFLEDTDLSNDGGDLYIHLGDISEDILKDSRKSFENGLPADGVVEIGTDSTAWGLVSTTQSVVNTFDNDESSRSYQDVGLDGLENRYESSFFSDYMEEVAKIVNDQVYSLIKLDPANDSYHYFKGSDYDALDYDILQRYERYNGTEGNSPLTSQSSESYATAATTIPDVEDINDDNTLSESENYFSYKVSLRREDFVTGQNYITDTHSTRVTLANGDESDVTWYQFRIPIATPDETVGSIQDLTTVRFMRMIMKNWSSKSVLRFASLDLVRSDWRTYDQDLSEGSAASVNSSFEVATVNIEENGSRTPVNYILPPGVDRQLDAVNYTVQLNEQSVSMKVENLQDGDAKAIYKLYATDLRRYSRLKMFVHAEALENSSLSDGDLSIFIRLGLDYDDNYYEYEVPLSLTDFGSYNGDSDVDRELVWPESNYVDFPLSILTDLKANRDKILNRGDISLENQFSEDYLADSGQKNRVSIKGRPTLGEIQTIMIGVRNDNDLLNGAISGEVWVNELRITDIDDSGGWAFNGRVNGNIADIATYSFAGAIKSAGFSSIDESVVNSELEDYRSYDISTTIQTGNLLPANWGVTAPVYIGYSKEVITPEYNPLDTDIKTVDAIANAANDSIRDLIEEVALETHERKSFSVTNLKVAGKSERKKHFYDYSNLYLTYALNRYESKDDVIERYFESQSTFQIGYNYKFKDLTLAPFKDSKSKIISSLSLSFLPSNVDVRSEMNSFYSSLKYRNIENPDFVISTSYVQNFEWLRRYAFDYSPMKSIKLSFSATNGSKVDIPLWSAIEDSTSYSDPFTAYKKQALKGLKGGGRNTDYSQAVTASYTLPFTYIKPLNWISSTLTYGATYNWEAQQLIEDSDINLGNRINNSRNIQLSLNGSLDKLYSKSKYLKGVNAKLKSSSRRTTRTINSSTKKKKQLFTYRDSLKSFSADPILIKHRLSSDSVTVQVRTARGRFVKGEVETVDKNSVRFTPKDSIGIVGIRVHTYKDDSASKDLSPKDHIAGFLMMIKKINLSYQERGGITLSGFLPGSTFLGSSEFNGVTAPGLAFVLGQQDPNFGVKAMNNGWLTTDSLFYDPYIITKETLFNMKSTLSPFRGLKIELTGIHNHSQMRSEYYIYDQSSESWDTTPFAQTYSGTFNMSIVALSTSFKTDLYEQFKSNRTTISRRLSGERIENDFYEYSPNTPSADDPEYMDGYGSLSSEVILPSFYAAYIGEGAESVGLTPFPSISKTRPNWKVSYTVPLEFLGKRKDKVRSIKFGHSYKANYSVSTYSTSVNYERIEDGYSYKRDLSDNFVSRYDISSVSITESMSPLFSFDIQFASDLTAGFEIDRDRELFLSLANNWITETKNSNYSVTVGYKFNELVLPFSQGPKDFSNDLDLLVSLGVRDSKEFIRRLVEDDTQIVSGQEALTVKISADYDISNLLSVKLYYDRNSNNPYVSELYETINTEFGLSFRFALDPTTTKRK